MRLAALAGRRCGTWCCDERAPSLMTAVILGMTRAFGEALAVADGHRQRDARCPTGLFTPASTLTTVLTMGMGNEAMGTVYNDVLWSLAPAAVGACRSVFILIIHLHWARREASRSVASRFDMAARHVSPHRLGRTRIATGILTAIVGLVLLILAAIVFYILVAGAWQALRCELPHRQAAAVQGGRRHWPGAVQLVLPAVSHARHQRAHLAWARRSSCRSMRPTNWVTNVPPRRPSRRSRRLPSIVVGLFGFLFFVLYYGLGHSRSSPARWRSRCSTSPSWCASCQQALEDVPRSRSAMRAWPWASRAGRPRSTCCCPPPCPPSSPASCISAGRVFGEAAALIFTCRLRARRCIDFACFDLSSPS